MKVAYTAEQKRKAVATYRRLKSYAATIRQLGYPSRHVLFDWVRESGSVGRPKKRAYTSPKRYPWETKLEAVERVMAGEGVRDVAEGLSMTSHAALYEWVRIYRQKGQVGPMGRKEQIEAGACKTKAQLKKELPDGLEKLLLLRVARGEASRQVRPRQSRDQGDIRGEHARLRVAKDTAAPQETRRIRVREGGPQADEGGGRRGPLRQEEARLLELRRRDSPRHGRHPPPFVIDCFDGKVVFWAISDSSDNALVERMIDEGIVGSPRRGRRPIVHTDRGGHYRGSMWIEKLEG